MSHTKKSIIPAITPDAVQALLARITPMLRNNAGQLCPYQPAQPADPVKTSFTWHGEADCGTPVPEQGLSMLAEVTTYHTCGYAMFFKPSIAEVLAQIPAELVDKVVAFEVLFDANVTQIVSTADFYGHQTVTRLYSRA